MLSDVSEVPAASNISGQYSTLKKETAFSTKRW